MRITLIGGDVAGLVLFHSHLFATGLQQTNKKGESPNDSPFSGP